jgi:hypothetical protein
VNVRKRMGDLERKVATGHIAMPDAEKAQVLRPDESVEQRKAALIDKYGSAKGVLFVRIKGQDA